MSNPRNRPGRFLGWRVARLVAPDGAGEAQREEVRADHPDRADVPADCWQRTPVRDDDEGRLPVVRPDQEPVPVPDGRDGPVEPLTSVVVRQRAKGIGARRFEDAEAVRADGEVGAEVSAGESEVGAAVADGLDAGVGIAGEVLRCGAGRGDAERELPAVGIEEQVVEVAVDLVLDDVDDQSARPDDTVVEASVQDLLDRGDGRIGEGCAAEPHDLVGVGADIAAVGRSGVAADADDVAGGRKGLSASQRQGQGAGRVPDDECGGARDVNDSTLEFVGAFLHVASAGHPNEVGRRATDGRVRRGRQEQNEE